MSMFRRAQAAPIAAACRLSHAANWFAATMVLLIYYRRSVWFMLPMALIVSFSRVYNGVHYPSDVFAGAILKAGYAAAGVWTPRRALARESGVAGFPHLGMNACRRCCIRSPSHYPSPNPDARLLDVHWMRLAYLLIFVQLIANLLYLASGITDLTGDEALPMDLVETPRALVL